MAKTKIRIGDFFTVENPNDSDLWQVFKNGGKKPIETFGTRRNAIGTAQLWAWHLALAREVRFPAGSSV